MGEIVISINLCWQYFRAWMPMMLEKQYGYSKSRTQNFSSLYYLVAGIGCLLAGLVVKWLAGRGWPVHRARMATFAICVLLTAGQHRHGTAPGLLGVAGHPAGGRLWLAGPVSHVLCLHPGTLGAADGQGHGRAQLRDLDIDGVVQGLIGRWIDRTGSDAALTGLARLVLPLVCWHCCFFSGTSGVGLNSTLEHLAFPPSASSHDAAQTPTCHPGQSVRQYS
jgi:ACS family hexuronate transporter-like MFS transporter